MVYKRKYTKRRYKRKPKSRGTIYGAAAKQLYRDVRRLKDMVNVEYKEHTVLVNDGPINWDGVSNIPIFNLVPSGINDNQRIGDSIKCQNLTIRGSLRNNPANKETSTGFIQAMMVRMIIFWDKQNKTTTGNDLLQHVGSRLAPLSQKKEDNKYDSKIILDRTFRISYQTPIKTFKYVIPLNKHTHFNRALDDTDPIIENNALKIFFVSDVPTALTSEQPLLDMECSMSYTDN